MGIMQPTDRIIFALDVGQTDRALELADTLSGRVGMFKVGLELFIGSALAGVDLVSEVASRAKVFLDLKVHDIPATMRAALRSASSTGKVEFVTVHTSEGPEALATAVEQAGPVKALGVTVLTSVAGEQARALGYALTLEELVLARARWAKEGGLAGVVCSGHEAAAVREVIGKDMVIVTPGIRPAWEGVGAQDQRRVVTPARAIAEGANYIVVGRPIRDAKSPADAARRIADELSGVG